MENQSPIQQDYLCSGVPTLPARIGVQALDISTGTLYEQARNPSGATYRVVATKYYQPSYVPPDPVPAPSGSFVIDFGQSDTTTLVTVPQISITALSRVVFTPASRMEDFTLETIQLSVIEVTEGASFVVLAYAPLGTHSTYTINYTIL